MLLTGTPSGTKQPTVIATAEILWFRQRLCYRNNHICRPSDYSLLVILFAPLSRHFLYQFEVRSSYRPKNPISSLTSFSVNL